MEKKKTATQWLILGASFILILFVFAFLIKANILYLSGGAYGLVSAIFGMGGALFLLIGIVKFIIEKFSK
ncbi:MAG: hypothetical protein WC798_00745 [Candidatus Paceibacterota bacterium]|jgi:hypothetical protein